MNKKPSIYLAGSIYGLTYNEAVGWRNQIRDRIKDTFRVISPLDITELPATFDKEHDKMGFEYPEIVSSTKEVIYDRDHLYVKWADVLFVNLLQKEDSIGTLVEIGMATAWDKYIIIVANKDSKLLKHPFTTRRAHVVTTLEDGIECIERIAQGLS